MFPLDKRKLIRGAAAHVAAGLGIAGDWVASTGTKLFAPFDGTVETYWGTQGGNWFRLTRTNGDKIEMAHLDKYVITSGNVLIGQLIAYTGNTGTVTTGPHLHIQIFRDGKRIDPDKYNWEENVIIPPMTCEQELVQVKEENRKLNFELGVVTPQRDKALEDLKNEKISHAETIKRADGNYNNWQTELDKRKGLEVKILKAKQDLE